MIVPTILIRKEKAPNESELFQLQMVLRAGIEPARPQGTQDFLTSYDFHRLQIAVCGLDFTFTFYYFHSSQAGTVKSLHFFELI